MTRLLSCLWICLCSSALACDPTPETLAVEWWGNTPHCRHKAMSVHRTGQVNETRIRFDLSALADTTHVYHASLRMHSKLQPVRSDKRAYMNIGQGVFYHDPLQLFAEFRPDRPIVIRRVATLREDGSVEVGGEPLPLEPPQYKTFDVTEAVRQWVADPSSNLGLLVDTRGWRWWQEQTVLEIRYAGTPENLLSQAGDIQAMHRDGQTFLTWKEAEEIIEKQTLPWPEFETIFRKHAPREGKWYRIYRHHEPITPENLSRATLVDEVWPLSGWDYRLHQHKVRGEDWIGLDPEVRVSRYCIAEPPQGTLPLNEEVNGRTQWHNTPIPQHHGLYVHQPDKAGQSYYAVTYLAGGVENTLDITSANSLAEAVAETTARGRPILYRVLEQHIGHGRNRIPAETQSFVYWAAPPLANQPRRPIHVNVGLPGREPPTDVHTRLRIRNMYGNEIIRGSHPREWKEGYRILAIICDASYMTRGYWDSWNTLRPKREPSTFQPYAERLADFLTPWAAKLPKRLAVEE